MLSIALALTLPPSGVHAGTISRASQSDGPYRVYLPFTQAAGPAAAVDVSSRHSVLRFYRDAYLATQGTPLGWTGSQAACTPGTTSTAYRDAITSRINFFRAMAGVPGAIAFSDQANQLAQAAALMMSANRSLSHTPPSDWLCYSSAGAEGAGSANLHLSGAPADPITGYMRDAGAGNAALGHRRWLLYPQTQTMGTGDVPAAGGYPGANALVVFDGFMWQSRPAVRDGFVAWPPPGFVPYPVVFARWSFSYPGADFSAAVVSMTLNGAAVPLAQHPPVTGYGENTLAWIPLDLHDGAAWPRPAADVTYVVTLTNVRLDGQPRDFTYNVTIFDPG
jgi:hypothetical protein